MKTLRSAQPLFMKEQSKMRAQTIIVATMVLVGCDVYTPPQMPVIGSEPINRAIVRADASSVFQSVMRYSTSELFTITASDQDSGTISMQFSASRPSAYLDCGHFRLEDPLMPFDGNRADFSGHLHVRANIVITQSSHSASDVLVRAKYVLSQGPSVAGGTVFSGWSVVVDTGEITQSGEMQCTPTGALEKELIAAAKKAERP